MARQQKQNRSLEEWQAVFERFGASALTVRRFCQQERLGLSSFYHWRQRLATQDHHQAARTLEEPSGFLPLGSLSAASPVQRCELQFDFGAGRTLRVVCG